MKHHPLPNEEARIREKVLKRLAQKQAENPNFSLRLLARKVGINPGSLSYYLKGERSLNLETLFVLMSALEFDADEVLQLTVVSQGAYLVDSMLEHASNPDMLSSYERKVEDFQKKVTELSRRAPSEGCNMALKVFQSAL